MRIFSLFFVFTVVFGLQATAQTDKQRLSGGGGGYFQTGYVGMDVGTLNDFAPEGFDADLSGGLLMFGGGGFAVIERFMIGGSGYGLFGNSVSGRAGTELAGADYEASVGGGAGFFNLGYMTTTHRRFKTYAMLGIGGGGISVNYAEQRTVTFGASDYAPPANLNYSLGSFLVDASVNLMAFPLYGEDEDGGGGLSLGLSAGYTFAVASDNWQHAGGDVADAPEFDMSRFYVTLTIGGFGFGRPDNDD